MTDFQKRSMFVASISAVLLFMLAFAHSVLGYYSYTDDKVGETIWHVLMTLFCSGGFYAMTRMMKYIEKRAKEYEQTINPNSPQH